MSANCFTPCALRPEGDRSGVELELLHAEPIARLRVGDGRRLGCLYDARGHFNEPHDGRGFGIGTLEVRSYLKGFHDPALIDADVTKQRSIRRSEWQLQGGAVYRKGRFFRTAQGAKIAERFDIAVMSTKGMSVVAARALADEMCHDHDIPLLLLHDFDKSGFSIAGTLQRDTRRYEFQNSITTVDLGLNLQDVTAMGLESEYQHHPKGNKAALIGNLRNNGATDEEIEFMFRDFDRLDPRAGLS